MARQDGKCDMDVQIRLEQPSDYRETENVVREAFWNRYSPGCMEHYLLHVMRGSSNFVHELNYVAVSEEKVIGEVAFQKAFIVGDDGTRHEVLSMGPVALPRQRCGSYADKLRLRSSCRNRIQGNLIVWRPSVLHANRLYAGRAVWHQNFGKQVFCSLARAPVARKCLARVVRKIL